MSCDGRPFISCNSGMIPQSQSAKEMAEMIDFSASVEFPGVRSLTRNECENTRKGSMSSSSYSGAMYMSKHDIEEEDGSDECLHFGEKKRKLTFHQVKALEKSFELRNKLDPDRKMELAKALGLQPRKISVWFQNRRARSKIKQLENDFDALKQEYDNLKRNYDILLQQNRQFKAELVQRQGRELEKTDGSSNIRASEIEPQQNSDNSVPKIANLPMELSVKSEIYINCTEQLRHDNYPTVTKEQEGECSSIMTEATSSIFNINRPRMMESSEFLGVPQMATAAANRCSPVLVVEGSSAQEQVPAGGLKTPLQSLHEWHCQPKVEVDQISAEETQCNLFYSLEEEGALMLCEYWHLPAE